MIGRKSTPFFQKKATGSDPRRLLRFLAPVALALSAGCSLMVTRPVQEMNDATAAIRAAREVQAQTLAPELFRQSQEWFLRARRAYKFKEFAEALDYAGKARVFAEQSEFEAVRAGASRESINVSPPPPPPPPNPSSPESQGAPEQGTWAPLLDSPEGEAGGDAPPPPPPGKK
ncbi:MAG: DUF4398 domain-containing protein [Bdellovibrionales bacterium]|nr:DUF4398 domain-containing protein [Bdellovibrionales bacterium]